MYLYSIIVPIYGIDKYLKRCIESITNQTYRNLEIILVDDGSKDNSPQMCDEYQSIDNRIVVIHKQNGGLVSARKAGAEVATGEYVFCIDGDDWVCNNYVERFDSIIKTYKPDMVCCSYFQAIENENIPIKFPINGGYYDKININKYISKIAIESVGGKMFPAQLWAKCFKKELYIPEQLSVDSKIKIGEDGSVTKPMLTKATSLYVLDECLYFYRINMSSMTKSRAIYDWNGPRLIQSHLKNRIDITMADYNEQIIRRTAHDIYTVLYSQFNNKQSFFKLRRDIIKHLNEPDYSYVIRNCRFKGLKNKFWVFALKNKLFLFIFLLNKIRK